MSIKTVSQSKAIAGKNEDVEKVVTNYRDLFDEKKGGTIETRQEKYMFMVNSFYNMVTDLYEFGWGQSFHFAPRNKAESFETSLARHEHYLAYKLGLKKGMKAIDIGCGVGGPGRTIARFSGAHVTGLNNNEYQLERCKKLTSEQGPRELISYMKADFMSIPCEPATFDAGFQVEALPHSPNKLATFQEIYRILKPGGVFAGYDWIITNLHDPNNAEHVRIKKAIELGNSLPDLPLPEDILDAIRGAGFEVIEAFDVAANYNPETDIPWWDSLGAKYSTLSNFPHTTIGMWLTNKLVWALESVRIAPKGTLDVHNLLLKVAADLVVGGELGTFSPMYFYLIRKPLEGEEPKKK